MAIVRAQVILDSNTNLPEDAATNTYHFDTTGTAVPTLDNILDLLEDLYAEETATLPLMGLMSNELAAGTGRIRLYDLADTEPRAPIASREITRTPSTQDGLPAEVALCCSFQAAPSSGLPQARRRGRVFLPWLTEANNELGRPTQAIIDAVGAAFVEFGAAADASLNVDWVIYSRTNNNTVGVAGGWVDNAWDTQRRRGFKPTVRTAWP